MSDRFGSRIVVTGIGAVTAWGWGVEPLWAGVCGDRSAIGTFTRIDHRDYPTHLAAEVPQRRGATSRREPRGKRISFADRFALAAAAEATTAAGLPHDLSGLGAAVTFGSSTGGMFESERWYAELAEGSTRRDTVSALTSQQVSGPGDAIAREYRATGPVETVSSACSSATLALGLALDVLRNGEADTVIAGGSDSLCRVTYGGFNALRAVDERPCRPFRADRSGLSLGEGAGVLVLETMARALDRGATPLAVFLGAGASSDAYHMTAPHPEGRGAAAALTTALLDAGLGPGDVDFVNAHGTGTERNDVSEFRALKGVFGDRVRRIPVTSTKGSVGHLLGSAGAIEAVATVLCLFHQRVHPTPGSGDVDASAPVSLVRGTGLSGVELNVGASLNLGFGGSNGAVVFSRWVEA